MIYNDKNQCKNRDSRSLEDQPFVLNTEEDQSQEDFLSSNNNQNKISFNNINTLKVNNVTKKPPLPFNRHKKQQFNFAKVQQNQHKIIDSINKMEAKQIQAKAQFNKIRIQDYSTNSSMNSSAKMSNLRFVTDQQEYIHPQTKKFVQKYFPTYQNSYSSHFICLEDFIILLFEEFENVIGKQNADNFYYDFTQKIQQMFGNQVFFDELFDKTQQKGVVGLIFQVFKQIEQDQKNKRQRPNKLIVKQMPQVNKNSQNKEKMNPLSSFRFDQVSQSSTKSSKKISLNKFFGNSSRVSEQNITQIKSILVQYLETMYDEAQHQMSKKFSAEMRKITLKCKQAEHILQKINDKVSNHYNMLNMQKQYEKKIKTMNQKLSEQQNKIKQYEFTISSSQQFLQKQKLTNSQLNNQIQKLSKKLQKYENAILQKAFSNKQNQSSRLNNGLMEMSNNSVDRRNVQAKNSLQQTTKEPTFFKFQVDTVTQHAPMPTQNYTPYHSRMNPTVTSTYNSQPPFIVQADRRSVSPRYQRVTFNNQNDMNNKTYRLVSPIGKLSNEVNYGFNSHLQSSNVSRVVISKTPNFVSYPTKMNNQYEMDGQKRNHSPINIPFSTSRVVTLSPAKRNN